MNHRLKKHWHKNDLLCYNSPDRYNLTLNNLVIVGYMSVDVDRQYHGDLTKLKFLNTYPSKSVQLDLNHNINAAVKRTTDENNEKIDLLLKFLTDRNLNYSFQANIPDFITYRRTLINIMCCGNGTSEAIHFIASIYKGSIYLCSVESPHEKLRRQSRNKEEEKFCAWGYKFEQYLLSESPTAQPNLQEPVIENEEFSVYYSANIGDLKILYGAQIDGLLTNNTTISPPTTLDYETNLNYLKQNSFVELKTNREIQHHKQERNFKKYKLLRCWCQCYLAGLQGLLVGFRNDDGIVQRLQWFDTDDISRYCRSEWNSQRTVEFLHDSLVRIKQIFTPHQHEDGPVTFRLEINSDKEIKIIGDCSKEDILPKWYTDAVK